MDEPDSDPDGQTVSEEPRKARFGCGKVALMVLFLPFAPLVYPMPWGWRSANRVFQPRNSTAPSNATLDVLQTVRTVAGFFVVGSTFLYFDEEGLNAFGDQLGDKAVLTIIVGLPVLLGGTISFVVLARPEFRRELVSRSLRHSLVTIVYAGGVLLSILIAAEHFPVTFSDWGILNLPLAIGQCVIIGYCLGFWLRALFLIGKNVFNSSETHPLMPCVLTPLIAWVLTVVELLLGNSLLPGFLGNSLPTGVHTFLALSGAVAVTILSVAEWVYYRRTFGLSIRTGPNPTKPEPADAA